MSAVPAWLWLTAIVGVSSGVRYAIARRMVAPWIMVDELIYSELAKSFAATGHFLVRDQPTAAYGFVYPLLIAPAYRAFASVPDAYEAAKAINSVVMSLAAVPVYFLARRLLSPSLSLVAAALSVAIPSMAYTGTLMTENAFYPLFACVALVLVLVLEQPTVVRQLVLLGLCVVAFLTRAQAIAFLPAILTAPLLLALFDGRRREVWRRYSVLWIAAAAGLVLLPLVQVVRGRSVLSLFGAYEVAGKTHYSVVEVLRWLLYHVAELDLYLAVIPFAAFLVLVALAWRLPRRAQAFVAAAVALTFWLVLEVAVFASKNPIPPRVEERNMFYVAPLFIVALLVWIEFGLPRRHVAAGVAAVLAAALPGVLPYSKLIGVPAASDELALSIWWRLQDHVIGLSSVATWTVVASIVAATLFLLVPRRFAAVLPAAVLAVFLAVSWTAEDRVHGFQIGSLGALFQGITNHHRDWIDRAVGHNSDVAVLWTTCRSGKCPEPRSLTDEKIVWENEFFSRSVGPVYSLHDPMPGGLPGHRASFDPRTGWFTSDGSKIRAPYVLVDTSVEPLGTPIARDVHKGVVLYRLQGPLRQATRITGVYADTWAGPVVRYVRHECAGGVLFADLQADPSLIQRAQTVTATSNGRVVGRLVLRGNERTLPVRLRPRGGECTVEFATTPTAVPRHGDLRRLGVHFHSLQYTPPA